MRKDEKILIVTLIAIGVIIFAPTFYFIGTYMLDFSPFITIPLGTLIGAISPFME